jgi:PHD/YefM family antitoxin component YafN of YafNO toxin-antitoxin module
MKNLGYVVSIRHVQRYIQEVIAKVKRAPRPIILMNRTQPEIALVSLEQLKEFKRLQFQEKVTREVQKMKLKDADWFE